MRTSACKPEKSRSRGMGQIIPVLLLIMPSTGTAWAGGIAFGPPIVLMQHIPVGQEVDLFKTAGTAFTVYNRTPNSVRFTVQCMKPSALLQSWEVGYEEVPDPTWFRFQDTEATVDPGKEHLFKMSIHIPDQPEYYNRKWMLVVVAQPGEAPKMGVGMALAARVQLETLPRENAFGGVLSTTPHLIQVLDISPGEKRKVQFELRNNGSEPLRFSPQSIRSYFPPPAQEDEKQKSHRLDKPLRWFNGGVEPILDESWLKLNESWELEPGKNKTIGVEVRVPKSARPGKTYEEIIFLDGGSRVLLDEIGSISTFAQEWSQAKGDAANGLRKHFTQPLMDCLKALEADPDNPSRQVDPLPVKREIVAALNNILEDRDFAETQKGSQPQDPETWSLLNRPARERSNAEHERLSRLLMESIFPGSLQKRMIHGGHRRITFVRIRITVAEPGKGMP